MHPRVSEANSKRACVRMFSLIACLFFASIPGIAFAQSGADANNMGVEIAQYGFGQTSGNSCYSCDFVFWFSHGVMLFSERVFEFFRDAFLVLAPASMLMWFGYHFVKNGLYLEEQGRQKSLFHGFIEKFVIFFFAIALMGSTSQNWLWATFGPDLSEKAFVLSDGLTERSFAVSNIGGFDSGQFDMGCGGARASSGEPSASSSNFGQALVKTGCLVERTHLLGIAIGTTMFKSIFSSSTLHSDLSLVSLFFYAFIKFLAAFIVMIPFLLSFIWLTFLALDVVVTIAIVAGFIPALVFAGMWDPTRDLATRGIKMLFGSVFTALGIGIVMIVNYFLASNVVFLYNATYARVADFYDGLEMTPILAANRFDAYVEFLERVGRSFVSDGPVIPMNITDPWFIYLVLVGLGNYALGRKIISMINQVSGEGSHGFLANTALRQSKFIGSIGMSAALVGSAAALSLGAKGAGKLGSFASGMMSRSGKGESET